MRMKRWYSASDHGRSSVAGMMILAILICIPLWKLSNHSGGAGDSDALVTATEAQPTEATDIPETVMAPEVSMAEHYHTGA